MRNARRCRWRRCAASAPSFPSSPPPGSTTLPTSSASRSKILGYRHFVLNSYLKLNGKTFFINRKNLLSATQPTSSASGSQISGYRHFVLKGQRHKIFDLKFSTWISFPQTPDYTIRAVSNFFEHSRRYSHLKLHHPVANRKNLQL
jgi:hypothetical protein